MNYTDRITLHESSGRQYTPETGKTEIVVDEGVTLPCNVSAVSLDKTEAVFGSYKRNVATARLQRPYTGVADKAVIGTQKYNILRHVPHRSESVFYLEGVSEWT
ncbi:hypothetical protein [Oceanobacillus timonensis]|uniref:hypothetical protein n=1 Tax=Oceanobacillus timonensis TaxID=1926285 RepID=UPI0009BC4448|nr:hypothetical protein [Oceanobacillus timonensis]